MKQRAGLLLDKKGEVAKTMNHYRGFEFEQQMLDALTDALGDALGDHAQISATPGAPDELELTVSVR